MHRGVGLARTVLVVSVLLAVVGVAVAQSISVVGPTTYNSNGSLIAGWHWCRAVGHFLDWDWRPVPTRSVSVAAVNFALLVTNRPSGGSGYGAVVNITIYDPGGAVVETGVVHLVNPFLPQVATDTRGIGYRTYGAYQFQKPELIQHGFRIRLTWPPMCPSTYHFAGSNEGASLAYVP